MTQELTADEIIRLLGLSPLEGEGGFFRQTWLRPSAQPDVDPAPAATAILYLITPDSFSSLHRLRHDELFHFYLGDPCENVTVSPYGTVEEVVLGTDLRAGMQVQHMVPARFWQGTRLLRGGKFALLGTTMSPGFHPDDFELATADDIVNLEPSTRARVRDLLTAVER